MRRKLIVAGVVFAAVVTACLYLGQGRDRRVEVSGTPKAGRPEPVDSASHGASGARAYRFERHVQARMGGERLVDLRLRGRMEVKGPEMRLWFEKLPPVRITLDGETSRVW